MFWRWSGNFLNVFELWGFSAGSNIALLSEQVREFSPECVAIGDPDLVAPLAELLPPGYRSRILCSTEGNCAVATRAEADMVVSAGRCGGVASNVGCDSRRQGRGASQQGDPGHGGAVGDGEVRRHGVRLLPIDSEHSAIFQALEAGRSEDVGKLILTASSGPFRTWNIEQLRRATPEQALAHPNWSMERKFPSTPPH